MNSRRFMAAPFLICLLPIAGRRGRRVLFDLHLASEHGREVGQIVHRQRAVDGVDEPLWVRLSMTFVRSDDRRS
jgi:hypothetical protein